MAIADGTINIYYSPLLTSLNTGETTLPAADITDVATIEPTPYSLGSVTLTRTSGAPVTLRFQRSQTAALQQFVADVARVRVGDDPVGESTPIPGLDFVAIDVETANDDWGSIIEIGVTKVLNGLVEEQATWRCTPPPGMEDFLDENIAIHGIRPEDIEGEPSFAQRYELVKEFTGELPMVSHNAQFDFTALARACHASHCAAAPNEFGCSLALSRSRDLGFATNRLPDVCRGLGIALEHHHCAADDAEACARIITSLASIDGFTGSFPEFIASTGFTMGKIRNEGRIRSVQKIRHDRSSSPDRAREAAGNGRYKRTSSRRSGGVPWSAVSTPEKIPEPNTEANPDGLLYGQNVTLTGDFEPLDKGTLWSKIADQGATIGKNVTKKTTICAVGAWTKKTSKQKRAEELKEQGQDIAIWSKEKLFIVLGIDADAIAQENEPPF